MKNFWRTAIAATALVGLLALPVTSDAQPVPNTGKPLNIKTRAGALSGTPLILVLNYLPETITSITCDTWVMLGQNSWKHQNDFEIPSGPSVAVMNADHFQGYCKEANSIVAHTDDGDAVGTLDRGAGNWNGSTVLVFRSLHQ